jgi:hypothetical protein
LLRHRRGEERRGGDDVGVDRARRGEEALDRDVVAEIVHFEAVGGEQDADQPLADVVQVPLHRSEDDTTAVELAGTPRGERRQDHGHRRLHRLGPLDELGQEVLAVLPELSDPADTGGEAVLDGAEELGSRGDERERERARAPGVALDDRVAHLGHSWRRRHGPRLVAFPVAAHARTGGGRRHPSSRFPGAAGRPGRGWRGG